MISLKVEEAEVPISESTLAEIQASLEEMKKKGLKKCRILSPYSKTAFILSIDDGKSPSLQYGLRVQDHTEHA